MIANIEGMLVLARQEAGGTVNKIKFMQKMLPQRLVDGTLYAADDSVRGTWDGEDTVIFDKERLMKATRFTTALLNEVVTPLNHFMGSAGERDAVTKDEKAVLKGDPEDLPEDVGESEEVPADVAEEVEKLIGKGKMKKAKKLLKESKDLIGKKEYKALKKQIEAE